jgi:hypothetical protein
MGSVCRVALEIQWNTGCSAYPASERILITLNGRLTEFSLNINAISPGGFPIELTNFGTGRVT